MNKFILEKDANPNYLATICKIGELTPIEGSDFLVKTVVNGYDIVVSKDFKEGEIVVYFPVESCICEKYLSANNLYERSEFERNSNADSVKELLLKTDEEGISEDECAEIAAKIKTMCGFFNKTGRVRIIKLRGQYSQGFIAKVDSLVKYDSELSDVDWDSVVGTQFNKIGNDDFCWKYIPVSKSNEHHDDNANSSQRFWRKRMKRLKKFNRLIDGEFIFHYDTKMLAEHINELKPDDDVTVTVKVHGTSVIIAKVLVKRELSRWEKIKKFFRVKVSETEYGNIYSSRTKILNKYINKDADDGYYSDNVYDCVNKIFYPYLDNGMTVYGEIVGYTNGTQKMIQKNHDYGCKPGEWKVVIIFTMITVIASVIAYMGL